MITDRPELPLHGSDCHPKISPPRSADAHIDCQPMSPGHENPINQGFQPLRGLESYPQMGLRNTSLFAYCLPIFRDVFSGELVHLPMGEK